MTKMDDVLKSLAGNAESMTKNIEKARQRTRIMSRKLGEVQIADAQSAQTLLGLTAEEDE
jgi:DNA recombination protein RmuC